MDLVRDLMLKLEALDVSPGALESFHPTDPAIAIEGRSPDEIEAHLHMIYDAGFVIHDAEGRTISGEWMFRRLSTAGHDFIDSVRPPDVWQKTKAGFSSVGGWTLSLVAEVGKALVKQKAKQHFGLDL
jgi:hypothetical protein